MFSQRISAKLHTIKNDIIENVNSVNTTDTESLIPTNSTTSINLEYDDEYMEIESPSSIKTKLPISSALRTQIRKNRKNILKHDKLLILMNTAPSSSYENLNVCILVELKSNNILRNRQLLIAEAETYPVIGLVRNNININYYSDVFSLGVLESSFIESQTHREICSGLPFPIGLIPNDNLSTCHDSIMSISKPHRYLNIDNLGQLSIVQSRGNDDTFIILPIEKYNKEMTNKVVIRLSSDTAVEEIMSIVDEENVIGLMLDQDDQLILSQLNKITKSK
ncbi:unnamed protein product [Candida verbasci]|uniref:3-deoxy-D-arabino-heptulosonate 7-phosphate synthase n=1 Tax=Candida verbasci TaxID=1227364 RepID=A0A9W4TU17_9ASCO|nr:unnamed protein product [Candida verbasci]